MKAIGIDLGTTNSIVSVYERGAFRTVDIHGRRTTPSVVSWHPETGKRTVGHPAKQRVLMYPETSVVSNKRFMGDREKRYDILGKSYTPVDIAAILLKYLVEGASDSLGQTVTQAVVTVPAYFDGKQKEDTRQAAQDAGLEVLQLQAEPTAAAIAYGLNQAKDQVIMVYDLGGGTFDVSVLEVKDNRFTVKAVGGDTALGGDDFDRVIMDFLYDQIHNDVGVDLRKDEQTQARVARQKLKELAEQAKIELSASSRAEIVFPTLLDQYNFEYTLKRSTLKELITPYLTRTVQIMRDTLRNAGLGQDEINRVICVGGSTKSPLVKEIAYYDAFRPLITSDLGHPVRTKSATRYDGSRPPITNEVGHFCEPPRNGGRDRS